VLRTTSGKTVQGGCSSRNFGQIRLSCTRTLLSGLLIYHIFAWSISCSSLSRMLGQSRPGRPHDSGAWRAHCGLMRSPGPRESVKAICTPWLTLSAAPPSRCPYASSARKRGDSRLEHDLLGRITMLRFWASPRFPDLHGYHHLGASLACPRARMRSARSAKS
jgi:hypothetical protein